MCPSFRLLISQLTIVFPNLAQLVAEGEGLWAMTVWMSQWNAGRVKVFNATVVAQVMG
jgi:hypothetical protein